MVTGKSTRPYRSSLEPIAKFFSISVEQLLGETDLSTLTTHTLPTTDTQIIAIPLLEWIDLPNLNNPDIKKKMIAAMADLSKDCFAVIMNDSSMEPQFSKDSILIFDPAKLCSDRSYALVKLAGIDLYVFRQMLIDAEHKFLKPLNPDLTASQMRLLDDEHDKVIGILVEARQTYREKQQNA